MTSENGGKERIREKLERGDVRLRESRKQKREGLIERGEITSATVIAQDRGRN